MKTKDRSCHRIFVLKMLFGHTAACCSTPYCKIQLVLPKLHLTRKPVVVHFFFGDFWELLLIPNIRKPYVKTLESSSCLDLNALFHKTEIMNRLFYSSRSWSCHIRSLRWFYCKINQRCSLQLPTRVKESLIVYWNR